jgi:hypothetical protein
MRLPARMLSALPLSTAVLLGSAGLAGCAGNTIPETPVVQADVPAEAWKTIGDRTKAGTVTGLTKHRDGGLTIYTATWRQGNKDHEVAVYPDGSLASVETEITRPELPPAVGQTADLLTRTREAKIVRYFREDEYRLNRLESTGYEVKVLTTSGEFEYEIAADGSIREMEGTDKAGNPLTPTFDPNNPWGPAPQAAPAEGAAKSE